MNKHRGSDFNDFLIEEGIMTPTPTPRTDAIAHRGLGSVAYIAEMTGFARQLERELTVWKHEAKRLDEQLKAMEETAIVWWCEYQDLKAKARES
jgi:hypothetical protein